MQVQLDSAGRLVIPKSLRDALGLSPGQSLEVRLADGRLEIEPSPTPMRLVRKKGGAVSVPGESLPPLSAEVVRETLERIRR